MKKQLLFLGMLLSGTGAFAQINTQGEISASIDEQNPFLDASGYNAVGNSIAKGLYFPSTDLTTWEFKLDMIDPTKFSSYFDGMVVYNSGTGKTLADTSKGGKQVDVTPGFYYFKNPGQSFPVGSVANGQWVRLGAEVVAGNTTLGTLPKYSTADRDKLTGVAEGTIIYNTTTKKVEVYNGTSWDTVSGGATTNPGGGSTPGGSIDPGTGATPPGGGTGPDTGVTPPGGGTDPSTGVTPPGGQPDGNPIPPGAIVPDPGTYPGTGDIGGGVGVPRLKGSYSVYVPSVLKKDGYRGYQGIIDNSNNMLEFYIPYEAGSSGKYEGVSLRLPSVSEAGENGDSNEFLLEIAAGTFDRSGGVIPARLKVLGDGSFSVKRLPLPTKAGQIVEHNIVTYRVKLGTKEIVLFVNGVGGIADKCYDLTTRQCVGYGEEEKEHDFIYFPINGRDGNTWLNFNLGAEYAASKSSHFNPTKYKSYISYDDWRAYGSYFQWQRKPDGHELMRRSNDNFYHKYGVRSEQVSSWVKPGTNQFIKDNLRWVSGLDGPYNLWAPNGSNNPCPPGYHVPSKDELNKAKSVVSFASSGYVNSSGSYYSGYNNRLNWTYTYEYGNAQWSLFGNSIVGKDAVMGGGVRCLRD
ncbi:hypothetical protein MWN41_09380 [Ornithobacterium rhinotracheale]|uniref:hypothetical protein n=2 Tax=Ornithobacterium rhinotracheale TaxID=28251 RepID=UPI001FF10587|nr:hypothetical protein [Ornithobacterium rhinotracheale]MCK0203222.1 hypothetical protein [Ornithobacterium rhinotracheale]